MYWIDQSQIDPVLLESVSWCDTELVTVSWIDPVLLESVSCGIVLVIVVQVLVESVSD